MSIKFSDTTWKYLSESMDQLIRSYIESLVKPEIKRQHEKIRQFHLERLDPLDFHDMNYLEDHPNHSFGSKDSIISFEEDEGKPRIYGMFEFLSDLELNRFSLGNKPPIIELLNMQECSDMKILVELQKSSNGSSGTLNLLKKSGSFGPMSSLARRYLQNQDREKSLKNTLSLHRNENLKSVIGSEKLPSRMRNKRVENVDYSSIVLGKRICKSPVKNLTPEVTEVLNAIGSGVNVRLYVEFDSNIEVDIDTTIAVNEPLLKFIEIPIGIRMKRMKIAAEIVVSYRVETDTLELYLEKKSSISDKDLSSTPIKDFSLTVDIGDPSLGPVLRDTKKIATFAKEAILDLFSKNAIYPHQIQVTQFLEKALRNMPSHSEESTSNENF